MNGLVPGALAIMILSPSMAYPMDAATKRDSNLVPPPAWLDSLSVEGFLSGGGVVNFAQPFNKINFGHLMTDRANWLQFNQATLSVKRPLDPNATGLDFGLAFQGMIGTDARYVNVLGETGYLLHDRTQFAVAEANLSAHLPVLTDGGVDLKIGQFPTYNGFETLSALDRPFYTYAFSANFGPFINTGVMTTTHVADWLDVYAGVFSGLNTTFGRRGENNNALTLHAGLGLSLLEGDLSILAFTQSGPENPNVTDPLRVGWPYGVVGGVAAACACDPNRAWRYYNSLVANWKATENLTLVTDVTYYREEGWNPVSVTGLPIDMLDALGQSFNFDPSLVPRRPRGAQAYGVAQFAAYRVNDVATLNARVEFWRDAGNFFAYAAPGYFDNVNLLRGLPTPSLISRPAGRGTSYFAVTAGVTITAPIAGVPYLSSLIFRPEIRWDAALNDAAPFYGPHGPKRTQGLVSMDVILPFTIR